MTLVAFDTFKSIVIPGHNVESQKESTEKDESLIKTNVRDIVNNLGNMVKVNEGEEALAPKRRSYMV